MQVPAASLPHWKLISKSPQHVRGTYDGKGKQQIYELFTSNSNKHLLELPAAMDPKPGDRQSNGRQEFILQGMRWELQMQQQEKLVEASRRTPPATGTNNKCSESLINVVRHTQKVRFISDTAFNDADRIGPETCTKREENKTNTVRVNTTNKIK